MYRRRPLDLIALCLVSIAGASGYFVINQPSAGTQWSNGAVNAISWTKGLLDGIDTFDVELARLGTEGLIFVAREVPTTLYHSLNIRLLDVPTGDDYFLLFINSSHGLMYATSNRFSIISAPSSTITTSQQPMFDDKVPTVTVTGGPDPTKMFGTTFPPDPNAEKNAARAAGRDAGLWERVAGLGIVTVGCLVGAGWTLW